MEGTGQSVQISTTPAGAVCTVDRDGGRLGQVASTPGSIRVDKGKNDVVVTCSKEGFQTATISQSPKFVGTTFGNILLGGGIGAVVDAASGANFEYPAQVMLQLAPGGPAPMAYPGPLPTRNANPPPVPIAALPASASAVRSMAAPLFDGEYWGEMALVKVIGQCSRPNPSAVRALSISNGEVRFLYNFRLGTTLIGRIDNGGVFDASGQMPAGLVQMAGRVQGTVLAANIESPTCHYSFQAMKHI